ISAEYNHNYAPNWALPGAISTSDRRACAHGLGLLAAARRGTATPERLGRRRRSQARSGREPGAGQTVFSLFLRLSGHGPLPPDSRLLFERPRRLQPALPDVPDRAFP